MALRFSSIMLLVLASVGCASIQPLRDPARFIGESNPAVVYVTHKNGALLTITQPEVRGDSLLGIWQGIQQPLALPMEHVKRVEAIQRDKTRTIMLIAGVTVLAGSMGYLLTRDRASERVPCNFDGAQQMDGCGYYDL